MCGATFLAKTLDSRFCSRVCSKKYYNRKVAEQKQLAKLNAIAEQVPEARDYISVHEAVALFGISRDTIYRLIRKGGIQSINVGERLTRISRSDMQKHFPLCDAPSENVKSIPKTYDLEPENCYTVGEVAEKYGFNDSTVFLHIRKYSIPTRQIGNYVYVPKKEIDSLYKDVVRL